jgi:hypothetical protein
MKRLGMSIGLLLIALIVPSADLRLAEAQIASRSTGLAEQAVLEFFDALQEGDTTRAMDLLAGSARGRLEPSLVSPGYDELLRQRYAGSTIRIDSAEQLGPGAFHVTVSVWLNGQLALREGLTVEDIENPLATRAETASSLRITETETLP